MKKRNIFFALAAVALAATFVWAQGHLYVSSAIFKDYVYYSLNADVLSAPFAGQTWVVLVDGGQPYMQIYDGAEGAWDRFPLPDVAETITASWTFGGGVSLGDNEDDTITLNGAPVWNVRRTDFDFQGFYAEPTAGADMTLDVADTNTNYLHFPGSQITPLWLRFEQAFGGTFAPETVRAGGTDADGEGAVLLIDNAAILDVIDNDAVEFALFGDPDDVVLWDESSGLDAYCEISVRIDDISDISANDFYFGWFINAAITDAFNYEGADTWAAFGVLDTSGDLVIQAELNGGTHGEDDAGVTLADNGDYVLRVEMSADAVAFYVDGTAVTQTNATLDADDDDTFTCMFGVRSAGTSNAVIELEYIEIGLEQ